MRILLATGHPYLPQIAGGAQSSMHELAQALIAEGHQVATFSGLTGVGSLGWRARLSLKVRKSKLFRNDTLGYLAFRSWVPADAAQEVATAFAPDILCMMSGFPVPLSKAFRQAGVATLMYFRNVEDDDFGGEVAGSADGYLANSQFTASKMRERHGVDCSVIPPLVNGKCYATRTSRHYVTLINPHPLKGRDIAFELVKRCQDIPFLFVKAWTLEKEDQTALDELNSRFPNVDVRDRTEDMKTVYAQTRIVLIPSIWEEAWGRVATEAHFSGIPVIASRTGGLPESVGPGGVLISPDASVQAWVDALRALTRNEQLYRKLSRAARDYSKRKEMQPGMQLAHFIKAANKAITAHRSVLTPDSS
ncbi:glycosyltransferase [Qipengyuania seohaensis]|uniref:glycosyltransferase n=1 Tax=Qipengyuania seohaensis TaxID=266951 RepID=UPI000C22BD26|nr:glycosyltransferase [Qipengyuania seohaensis]